MDTLPFDYHRIIAAMNLHDVSYLLVGGLNFFLLHKPVTTQDIDLLVDDTPSNRERCLKGLAELDAEWGRGDDDWGPVKDKTYDWISSQSVYCLLTPFGPLDIFRSIPGIPDYAQAFSRAVNLEIAPLISVKLLSAADLLACQMALPDTHRKHDRVAYLKGLDHHG